MRGVHVFDLDLVHELFSLLHLLYGRKYKFNHLLWVYVWYDVFSWKAVFFCDHDVMSTL